MKTKTHKPIVAPDGKIVGTAKSITEAALVLSLLIDDSLKVKVPDFAELPTHFTFR